MAAQLGNYVLETATSPGTGGFTLNGAEANRRPFSTAFPNGGNVLYFADDGSQAEWGIGTLTVGTPSTLARSTVLGNTAGTKVALNFPGSVEVYNEIPAEMVAVLEQDGSLALAGSLTVKGKTLVQNVDDFTSQEAVPAKQADGRYVGKAQGNQDYPAIQAGINKFTGNPWLSYNDGSGVKFAVAQQAGDYATNTALNTEITNRTNADTNLNNTKVNRAGDIMFGALTSSGYINGGVNGGMAGSKTPGSYMYTNAGIGFGNPYGSGTFRGTWNVSDIYGNGGADNAGINLTGYDATATIHQWYFAWNGNITTPKGKVAFASEIPTAGTIPGGTYTKIPMNDGTGRSVLTQCFSVSVTNFSIITFPIALSAAPSHVNFEVNQNIDCDCSYTDASGSSLMIHLWQNGTIQIDVMVIGVVY